jgi:transposase
MPTKPVPADKLRDLIILHGFFQPSLRELGGLLRLSSSTVKKYLRVFKASSLSLTDIQRLSDSALRARLAPLRPKLENRRQDKLIALLPTVHQHLKECGSTLLQEWESYREQKPHSYSYSQFTNLYLQWRSANGLQKPRRNRWTLILSPENLEILREWRSSSNKRRWERAVALLGLHNECTMKSICGKLERAPRTIKKWRRIFLSDDLSGLALPSKRAVDKARLDIIARKKERLIKIIHEPPSLHGVNRTTWTLETLSAAYRKIHGEGVSRSMVSQYFKELGYKFKKARRVLTSPDPDYRTKLKQITAVLSRLGAREKFFSIDEFGPCAVKRRGGRALVPADEIRTIPQRQRSKGSLICTAALELSTNQVTHFYSKRKNTTEMIKMLEVVVTKYNDQDRIFLSWDAASWHASKAFNKRVETINAQRGNAASQGPRVELAPLPSGAQFLNVIESVFSGMARAVIHNSNYSSVDECKRAIDRYFRERNEAFAKNPRRAGNVIWGKERVPASFSDANNCKDPRYR